MSTLKSFTFLALLNAAAPLIAMEEQSAITVPQTGEIKEVEAYLQWKKAQLIVDEIQYAPKTIPKHAKKILFEEDYMTLRRVMRLVGPSESGKAMSQAINNEINKETNNPDRMTWGRRSVSCIALLRMEKAAVYNPSVCPVTEQEKWEYLPEEIHLFPLIKSVRTLASDIVKDEKKISEAVRSMTAEENRDVTSTARLLMYLMSDQACVAKMAQVIKGRKKIPCFVDNFDLDVCSYIDNNRKILYFEETRRALSAQDAQIKNELDGILAQFPTAPAYPLWSNCHPLVGSEQEKGIFFCEID